MWIKISIILILTLISITGRFVIRHDHGLLIHSDGFYYYAYGRSLLYDGDLDFSNEYDFYRSVQERKTLGDGYGFDENRLTRTGMSPNPWAVGMAFFLFPFFLAGAGAHLLISKFFMVSAVYAGYSFSEQFAWLFGSAFYGSVGVVIVYSILCKYVEGKIALLATMSTLLATNLIYYVVIATWMAHGISFFIVSLYFYFWESTRQNRSLWQWRILGILGGLCFLVRWQNVLFNVVIVVEWIILFYKSLKEITSRQYLKIVQSGICFIGGLFAGMLPQLLVWRSLYGNWLTYPQGGGMFEMYWYPHFLLTNLFSTGDGLFVATPLIIFSLIGLTFWCWHDRLVGVCFWIAFLSQIWINASVNYSGASFGARKYVNCGLVFAVGLAALLKYGPKWVTYKKWIGVLSALILWNGLYLLQYTFALIPRDQPLTFKQFVIDKLLLPVGLVYKVILNPK